MGHLLSPRSVAAAIGASESSLKRWADEGLLHVSRTAGGHRRIELSEVLRYIRKTGTPIIKPEALGLADLSPESTSRLAHGDQNSFLVESILKGDLAVTRTALLSRYLAGESVANLCDGPLREAMERVGKLWHHGPEGIHEEHRSVDACIHALHYLRSLLPAPAAGALLGLGGGPAGDPYIIPSLMVATVLAAEGWREINLGPNVPVLALMAAMKKFKPRLVWISFTTRQGSEASLKDLSEAVELAATIGASLVAGGKAASSRKPILPLPFQILPTMEALAGFARGLSAAQSAPDSSRSTDGLPSQPDH